MEVNKTDIEGLVIIEPTVHRDNRGYFYETFNAREFENKTGVKTVFVQDNESMSSHGVFRGLHWQKNPNAQSKLVRCIKGEVIDIAVDIRVGSPTFLKYVAVKLSAENKRQFFIPRGFAHAFYVKSDEAIFQYKCDNFWSKEDECSFNSNVMDLSFLNDDFEVINGECSKTPVDNAIELNKSDKDINAPSIDEMMIRYNNGEKVLFDINDKLY